MVCDVRLPGVVSVCCEMQPVGTAVAGNLVEEQNKSNTVMFASGAQCSTVGWQAWPKVRQREYGLVYIVSTPTSESLPSMETSPHGKRFLLVDQEGKGESNDI